MSLGVGARLGHYSVTAKLGERGMGERYRARDTKLDRDVVLKVLPAERMRRCGHSPNLEPDVNRGTKR